MLACVFGNTLVHISEAFCNYRIEIFIGRKPSELFEATEYEQCVFSSP